MYCGTCNIYIYIYTLIYIQHAPNTIYIALYEHIYIYIYVVSNRHSGHLYTSDLSPNEYINGYLKTAISLEEVLGKHGQPIATFMMPLMTFFRVGIRNGHHVKTTYPLVI